MSGKDFLIDAVAQFLQSSAWLDAVAEFLETHFRKFLVVPDPNSLDQGDSKDFKGCENEKGTQNYSLEQYDTFLLFKDLVERLLEQVIADLGCSGEDLVEVLEESARLGEHASGERQFFIKTLLSFEDYGAFAEKIGQFAAEKLGAWWCYRSNQQLCMPTTSLTNLLPAASGYVIDEVPPTSDDNATLEYLEWILQLAIAKSILESKERGELDETEEGLVSWAEALVEMSQHSADIQVQSQETTTDEGTSSWNCKSEARAVVSVAGLSI